MTSCIVFFGVSTLQCGFRLTPKQVNTVSMFAVPLNNYKRAVLSSCGWPPLPRVSMIATMTLQSLNLSQKSCLSFCLFSSMVHSGQLEDRKSHSQTRWPRCCCGRPSYYTYYMTQGFLTSVIKCADIYCSLWSNDGHHETNRSPAELIIRYSHQHTQLHLCVSNTLAF